MPASPRFFIENTAVSNHNVRIEIDRCISWPAQALSYKIGEIKIKIKDLRDIVEDALLANRYISLFVVEEKMMEFINSPNSKVELDGLTCVRLISNVKATR